MMKSNYLRLADVRRVAKQFNAPLRVNAYQAVRSDLYALTYEEYWHGFQHLFEGTIVIAIGEPLVRAMGAPAGEEFLLDIALQLIARGARFRGTPPSEGPT